MSCKNVRHFFENYNFLRGFSDIDIKRLRCPVCRGALSGTILFYNLSHGGDLQWLLNH